VTGGQTQRSEAATKAERGIHSAAATFLVYAMPKVEKLRNEFRAPFGCGFAARRPLR
jgi:hypothetical protein